jgi:hypothetical protein
MRNDLSLFQRSLEIYKKVLAMLRISKKKDYQDETFLFSKKGIIKPWPLLSKL